MAHYIGLSKRDLGGMEQFMNVKKIFAVSGIAIAALAVLLGIGAATAYYMALQRPSMRFLLSNAGFREPKNYIKKEEFIDVRGEKDSVMVYRHPKARSKKYFMLQHGLTPAGNKHPEIDRLAASLCDATGMNIVVPYVKGSVEGGSLVKTYGLMADIYAALVKSYPGRYRAFGACIGANILLVALNRVPADIYPEKIFMLGPFYDGKKLIEYYNKISSPEEIDIMVKMAITLNMDIFSGPEKALIRKAIAASRPGRTDRSEMKQILGDRLFNDIAVVKLRHADLENINPGTMFGGRSARCKYFILHSMTDDIIPYFEGRNLAEFMKKSGMSANFLGTEYVEHAQNRASVTGFLNEMEYLIKFFDELFDGDVEI